MTSEQAMECMQLLCELFPHAELTEAELKLISENLMGFDVEVARNAIGKYRLDCDFNRPKLPRLFAIVRAAQANDQPPENRAEGSLADVLRSRHPRWSGYSDVEVYLLYWRKTWIQYASFLNDRMQGPASDSEKKLAERQAQGFAAKCRCSCIGCMVSVKTDYDAARAWTEIIFADAPTFDYSIDDLRANGIKQAPQKAMVVDAQKFMPVFQSPPAPQAHQPYRLIRKLDEAEQEEKVSV